MPELITAKILKKAFKDHRDGGRYDVSDSRIAGLQLRVKPDAGVRWSMRARLHGDQRRYDLGPAVAGDQDIDGLSIDGARARASRVAEMTRQGHNPATYLAALAAGVSMETQIRIERERPQPSWTWEDAKKAFLAETLRTRREDTHRDYNGKLQPPELSRFDGRLVNTISRNEMAAAIADVHARGKEAMAEGMVRVIRRMWNWLAEATRQNATSVADGVMLKLEAPERTRVELGEEAFDPDDEDGYTPDPIEIGRALAVARLGCLPERIGLGLELMIGTVQRRRAVTGASRWRFKEYAEVKGEQAWYVPPYFRKSGTKRGNRSHLVPVVGYAALAAARLDKLSDFEGSEGWLFPAGKSTRADRGHAESGLFNDWLSAIPGVSFSTHGGRYAFTTHGERDLGFAQAEGKLILDHLEGVEPTDVTGQFYSSDPQISRKRAMMKAWTAWCDEWTAKAIKDDRTLLNADLIGRTIRDERYKHKKKKAPG
ncbi:Arm DNA-binding domain-containing protein [Bradyrhizobium arachidis]|uniref:Arm DNA-binding domain-containing protein n=1 Tax=Bradyrhizobium arachidis TaxID=858423 RepID=UPI00216177DA|nr:Arm DNA-binding domain-containing protein [Bradyrhizobium arachidis]UVO31460.1 integrase arm-type DNA-binding domain-containing protein [Bradyrhizobium arachidis]